MGGSLGEIRRASFNSKNLGIGIAMLRDVGVGGMPFGMQLVGFCLSTLAIFLSDLEV